MGILSFNPLEPYSLEIDLRTLSPGSCTINIVQECLTGRGKKRGPAHVAVRKACFIRNPMRDGQVRMLPSRRLPADIFEKCRAKALYALDPESGLYDEAQARREGIITDERVAEIGDMALSALKCRSFFYKDRYEGLHEEVERYLEGRFGTFSSPGWVSAIHRYILLQLEIEEVRRDLEKTLKQSSA